MCVAKNNVPVLVLKVHIYLPLSSELWENYIWFSYRKWHNSIAWINFLSHYSLVYSQLALIYTMIYIHSLLYIFIGVIGVMPVIVVLSRDNLGSNLSPMSTVLKFGVLVKNLTKYCRWFDALGNERSLSPFLFLVPLSRSY